MPVAEIAIAVLGVLALLLIGAIVFVYNAKASAESALRDEIEKLRVQLTDAAKSIGQIEELQRSLEGAQAATRAEADKLEAERSAREALSRELVTAKAEAKNAAEAAETLVRQEQETARRLIEAERVSRDQVLAAKDGELAAKNQELEGLKEFLEKANAVLGDQFKAISHETLEKFSAQFEKAATKVIEQNTEATEKNVKLHKQQIEQMLQPVGKTLEQLNSQVQETNEKRGAAEAVLMAQIKEFAGANEKLASALSKPVIRGSFGEHKLEQLLEAAGLVHGEDFELQFTLREASPTRIVDAMVNLPQRKKLIIDSKNLLKPYVEFATAEGEERAVRLLEFQQHFRSTLRSLSLKEYAKHVDGIDAVIMFLPDEGMYMAAIESDRQLIATMFEHRVFTVSPISLLPILRSIAYILGLEKQNRDTQEIVDAGKALYESLGTVIDKVIGLGSKIDGGVTAYNDLIASFEGRVIPRTRKMEKLGVQKGAQHKALVRLETGRRRAFKEEVVREFPAGLDNPILPMFEFAREEEEEPLTAL